MNKPIFVLITGILMLSVLSLNAKDFGDIDRDFQFTEDYNSCKLALESMLETVSTDVERSQVLWRISRVYLVLGELQQDKEQKKPYYAKGIEYALQAIEADPQNPAAYMWHCASVGRDCQMKPLMEQAKAVPVMMRDLEMILDKLGFVNYSEAWQALAEIYYNHPFKSGDAAINFMRQAVKTIPSEELRISTSVYLAQLLKKRDWSVQKRSSVSAQNASAYVRAKTNIERCSFLDGADKRYGEISDKEEAASIISDALSRYLKASRHSAVDEKDYKELLKLQ